MLYSVLADIVLVLHFAFVAFVVFGGLLALRWPRLVWIHVPALAWGVLIEYAGIICPFTPLENSFRQHAGQAGYGGGFIDHYITATIYPAGLTRATQILLGTALVVANAAIYARILARRR